MDKVKVHTAKVVSSVMPDLRLKRTPQPAYGPDTCPSDFFLSGWLKWKLQQQQLTDLGQLFKVVDDTFSSLSLDMTKDLFQTWNHRLIQVIASDGDYVL
jgi:hypothetical protein